MPSFAEPRPLIVGVLLAAVIAGLGAGLRAQSAPAAALFEDARTLEQTLRREIGARRAATPAAPLVHRARILVDTYEDIARLFPTSGYGDKSLWQGTMLAADVFEIFKDPSDRATAVRLSDTLRAKYAGSSLVAQADRRLRSLAPAPAAAPAASGTTAPGAATEPNAATFTSTAEPAATVPAVAPARAPAVPAPTPKPVTAASRTQTPAALRNIRREVLPDVVRVTIELEREIAFDDERLDGPPRVFVDLHNTRAAAAIKDVLAFEDDVVRRIRVGRQLDRRVRVVLDLNDAPGHSIYTLYGPFRIVIDFERRRVAPEPVAAAPAAESSRVAAPSTPPPAPSPAAAANALPADVVPAANTVAAAPVAAAVAVPPIAPANPDQPISVPRSLVTRPGGLSMSRQLGLGVSRVVIDPGHGGQDPGASENGVTESEVVLDVALRLEQILQKANVEAVLTRRSNVYVPLEDRPAVATREQADLYLSIHANASADRRTRGIETYILNFSRSVRSDAVAARENRGSARTMKNLPDIVRAIALNNKVDESRALARQVQASLVEKLSRGNRTVRNLGVKEAPFAVLIGTEMPSILAEIGFITNRQDAALVKTAVYRQQVAEALADGILKYQGRLKPSQVTAASQ